MVLPKVLLGCKVTLSGVRKLVCNVPNNVLRAFSKTAIFKFAGQLKKKCRSEKTGDKNVLREGGGRCGWMGQEEEGARRSQEHRSLPSCSID